MDLAPNHLAVVKDILGRIVPGHKVVAFGSRVAGCARKYSDLDLAICSREPLPVNIFGTLTEAFENSDLPFRVDVVDWAACQENFRAIIERQCEVVQEQSTPH